MCNISVVNKRPALGYNYTRDVSPSPSLLQMSMRSSYIQCDYKLPFRPSYSVHNGLTDCGMG